MENEQSFYTLDQKWIPFLLIFGTIAFVSILVYVFWSKRYKSIPDKTVTAKLFKKVHYGEGDIRDSMDYRGSYDVGKYQYYMNGKRYVYKYAVYGTAPNEITLYYKKGRFDIRHEKAFSIPHQLKVFMLLYYLIGVPILTIIIAGVLGYAI